MRCHFPTMSALGSYCLFLYFTRHEHHDHRSPLGIFCHDHSQVRLLPNLSHSPDYLPDFHDKWTAWWPVVYFLCQSLLNHVCMSAWPQEGPSQSPPSLGQWQPQYKTQSVLENAFIISSFPVRYPCTDYFLSFEKASLLRWFVFNK